MSEIEAKSAQPLSPAAWHSISPFDPELKKRKLGSELQLAGSIGTASARTTARRGAGIAPVRMTKRIEDIRLKRQARAFMSLNALRSERSQS